MYLRFLVLAVTLLTASLQPASGQLRTVAAVVDGERVLLSDGSKIRLAGVNAPELHPSSDLTREAALTGKSEEAVRRQGEIAAAFLRMLAMGKPVLVEFERSATERVLHPTSYEPAYLYVIDEQGQVAYALNERMIGDGYARKDLGRRFSLEKKYEELEMLARKEERGFWASGSAYGMSTPLKSKSSDGADLHSRCRTDPGCVWMGQINGSGGAVGYWKSKPGRSCACADL